MKKRRKIDPKRLGRFHIVLGTFQEAPERESLIFHWFWEVLVGARQGRAIPTRGLSDPLNLKIKPNTIRARPMGLGKHRHKVLGLGRARPMGLGLVFGV